MVSVGAAGTRVRAARLNRSRTMSDLDRWRSRDSASRSFTRAAGRRTVSVFIASDCKTVLPWLQDTEPPQPSGVHAKMERPRPLAAAAGGAGRGGRSRDGLVRHLADAGDLRKPGLLQRLVDAVADPLAVPPLDRRYRHSGDEHLEVQVIADGQAGGARASELLPPGDLVARLDVDRRQVRVERLQPEAVSAGGPESPSASARDR